MAESTPPPADTWTYDPETPSPIMRLPTEVVLAMGENLHAIEDLHYLSCTCKHIQTQLVKVSPKSILRLTMRSSCKLFYEGSQPWNSGRQIPLPSIALVANQLSMWSISKSGNWGILCSAIARGFGSIDYLGLGKCSKASGRDSGTTILDLCLKHCGLTMDDIRRLRPRKSTGSIWQGIEMARVYFEEFEYHHNISSDPEIDEYHNHHDRNDAAFTFYHVAIYGSLFKPILGKSLNSKTFNALHPRRNYMDYCVKDKYMLERLERFESVVSLEWNADMDEEEDFEDDDGDLPWIFKEQWKNSLWECVFLFQGAERMGEVSEEVINKKAQIYAMIEEPQYHRLKIPEHILRIPTWPSFRHDAQFSRIRRQAIDARKLNSEKEFWQDVEATKDQHHSELRRLWLMTRDE
ncbi:hypothetical protein BT63DRAFT_465829 [Microthyrium microscopicum]|uniref:Uncharacterized protein n=1 Tax=Microthyrium microscopicum TaxID=703497 RepID=A0A6A6TX74_9PEZI|nr:hypothetical protein BT63DRAFT_465829 [Microthyrium microscopicum]